MAAFLLIFAAVLSRLLPHAGWFNFTAVGGSLLYFGARRPLRQAAWALLPLMATDYYLTAAVYRSAFQAQEYLLTWVWYAAALVLGSLLLRERTSVLRVGSGALLASTSFFALSNYAVWVGSAMYPHSLGGLTACYAAALPFYRNDLVSTLTVTGLAFGMEALVRQARHALAEHNQGIAA
jgi:Family of unknown function (DUF6580)